MNPNQSETKFLIRMNPRSEWFGLIQIESSVWINPSSDWKLGCGLVRIHSDYWLGLNRIRSDRFFTVFIKRDSKCFSDWFGMIRIGSDTGIGMNQNSCDWLRMNSYPILSPGNYQYYWKSENRFYAPDLSGTSHI